MNDQEDGMSEINLKLGRDGRYTWSISTTFLKEDGEGAIERLKTWDSKLQDRFPNFAQKGMGRVGSFNLEDE